MSVVTLNYVASGDVAVGKGRVWKFFLIGQNRSGNQRSGMILEVQIQNFGARAKSRRTRVKVFILKKFQGTQL